MQEKQQISNLLKYTRKIIKLQKEISKLKGETFNVFSILKLERRENRTHSSFIGELLNPKGSHNYGHIFLDLFLKIIDNEGIDTKSAKLFLEHKIGVRNDTDKTGGRVDIYIKDKKANILLIENKIDASDQNCQIERYCNYKKKKTKVYYLTLHGSEPSRKSCGDLIHGEHFELISYRDHIKQWLQSCLKETVDQPILRETIKQYLILIKKLTGTMGEENENALVNLMLEYYEESSIISSNFIAAQEKIFDQVRDQVVMKLGNKLDKKYKVEKGSSVKKRIAQIWIKFTDMPDAPMYFGVESFTGKGNFGGKIFVGILNRSGKKVDSFGDDSDEGFSSWWPKHKMIEDYKGISVNLNQANLLIDINSMKGFLDGFTDYIADAVVEYIQQETPALMAYLEKVR